MSRAEARQLDLFGEVEAREAERAAWEARFERADWIAPYDTAGGMKKGESKPGWRCPDPECGVIEPSGFLLRLNHGFDPHVPGHQDFDGQCTRVRLLRNQAAYDRRHGTVSTP